MELHSNANLIKKMLTPIINRKAKQDHVTLHPVVKFYRSPEYSLDLYADPPESYSVDSRKMGSYSHRNYFDDLRSSQNEQARKNNGSSMKQHSFDKKNVVIIGPKDYIQNNNGVIIQNRIYYPPYQAYQMNPQLSAMKSPGQEATSNSYQPKAKKDLAYQEKQYLIDGKSNVTLFQNHLQQTHKKNDSTFSQSGHSTKKAIQNSIFLPAAKGSLSTSTQSPV